MSTRPATFSVLISLAAAVMVASPGRALVITPMWDSSITDLPNAEAIEAEIQTALDDYQARFTDDVSVLINFQSVSDGLGASSTYFSDIGYSSFRAKLAARVTTADDATALGHLPVGPDGPVNRIATLALTLPHLRLLGVDASPDPGEPDSTVSLNLAIMNIGRTDIDPDKYDLRSTVYHEVNEVLGLSSALDGLANGDAAPTDAIGVLDLFRYKANGQRSFDTGVNTKAFFSIDGATDLAQFNQDETGDFHDWAETSVARVQDAFAGPGTFQDQGEAELTALDVIGYTQVPTTVAVSGGTFTNGKFGFDLLGAVGKTVVVDTSTDLKTWTPIWTNTLTGLLHFTDDRSSGVPLRAYRARVP
ncbi:MAG TPA: NF038122 family metalloprotease [Candidatus Limnocylindria bacterium]|nr:NF038122 family metalloprotease [Candidatus Limnocylindria bacterium]